MQTTRFILVLVLSLLGTRAEAQQHLFTAEAKEMPERSLREGTVGYVYAASMKVAGTVPVYRWFEAATGDHLLTIDPNEPPAGQRGNWKAEGIVFHAFPPGTKDMVPVKRLYNAKLHDHLYLTDEAEIQSLVGPSWTLEGVAFSVSATWVKSGSVPLYRLINDGSVSAAGVCPGKIARCDWRCVTLASDPVHCGKCFNGCAIDSVCSAGACVPECGGAGRACCASSKCAAGLKCVANKCK